MIGMSESDRPTPAPFSLPAVVRALPDVALAGAFLVTWISPEALGDGAFLYLFTVIGLELLAINSGAFFLYFYLAFGRTGAVIGLVAFGGLFYVVGQAVETMTGDTWAYFALAGLTLNRMKLVLFRPISNATRRQIFFQWIVPFGLLIGAFFVAFLLPLPDLGLPDPAVYASPGGEELVFEDANVLMAVGLLYFAAQAGIDLSPPRWLQS
jgi:hypothetical protein